jgi:acetyltransferase-like isoleucine patch superfamily enzyme
MSFIQKIAYRLERYACLSSQQWRLHRFSRRERACLKRLEIGKDVVFHVPVRSSGMGSLLIGDDNSFGYSLSTILGTGEILLQPRTRQGVIVIGRDNCFNNNVTMVANESIIIGDHCQIGDQVAIYDCDFHEVNPATRNRSPGPVRPVTIGNNVWLGSRVIVLKGVTIGENSVIGAMSLVNKSIPANTIAAGNPAKVIRSIE